ncbi:MAG: S8 family peptidase [Ignavibacteriales bacterium]|nr:S8 family peptidase [Ignavibacteriales bacterium]
MSQHLLRYIFLFGIILLILTANAFGQKEKYWVFFTNKGYSTQSTGLLQKDSRENEIVESYLDKHALARRAKTLPAGHLTDAADIPIYEPYIKSIEQAGGILARQSRWLNAASFYLSLTLKNEILKLPFVQKVQPVIIFRGKSIQQKISDAQSEIMKQQSFDYGRSAAQLNVINVPPLHTLGLTGKGVRIGLLDSGFRWKTHEALSSRKIIAEHDFIFNDNNTANEKNDSNNQDAHGTLTFSIIAGYQLGKLIGASFDSEFLLGKTEYIPSETIQEEDNWVAGIEWMESLGVDIISSSVGYDIFDDGTGYYWANGDFNGRTSLVARAAVRATQFGVLVCTSMGNEGNGNGTEGTLLTPADADSIISVGGVEFDKNNNLHLWQSSSTGPTNDGRIKPDAVALAVGVYHATVPGPATYGSSQGNSVSTPLVAGAAALILSARPELTPIQIRNAIRETARHVDTLNYPSFPNNFLGWGLVDAFRAATYYGPIFSNEPSVITRSGKSIVSVHAISSYGLNPDSVLIHFTDGSKADRTLTMVLDSSAYFSTSGKYIIEIPEEQLGTAIKFYITAVDSAGKSFQTPAPSQDRFWWIYYGIPGLQSEPQIVRTISLQQNFPNPFYSAQSFPGGWIPGNITVIPFELTKTEKVIIKIYNMLGEEIDEVANGIYGAGRNSVVWNAARFPSGIYFYRLSTSAMSTTKKMVFLR